MKDDYRQSAAGRRRFKYPRIYRLTFHLQNFLNRLGIAWHNRFSDECTHDFGCCSGEGSLNLRIGFTAAALVVGNNTHFLGIGFNRIATNRVQIRIGLVAWHVVITWTHPRRGAIPQEEDKVRGPSTSSR